MKTEVIMKRELFGSDISQKSKSEFFSATDLVRAGNKWRMLNSLPFFNMQEWLRQKSTKDFIKELEKVYEKVKIAGRGRNAHTWVHPFLFIDLALAINPKLKIEVYKWIYDELIKYRNNSGDSYKKMTGALWLNCSNKSKFKDGIKTTANMIKLACKVKNWETANEKQLHLRDKIHENISLLCDVLKDNNKAVKIGIMKSLEK